MSYIWDCFLTFSAVWIAYKIGFIANSYQNNKREAHRISRYAVSYWADANPDNPEKAIVLKYDLKNLRRALRYWDCYPEIISAMNSFEYLCTGGDFETKNISPRDIKEEMLFAIEEFDGAIDKHKLPLKAIVQEFWFWIYRN